MLNAFALTFIFIVVVTLVVAFIRGRSKDRCLKDFSGNIITLEKTTGKLIWGQLKIENTGAEEELGKNEH